MAVKVLKNKKGHHLCLQVMALGKIGSEFGG
jgi:hypothetical protein